jgi:hypothetical protein
MGPKEIAGTRLIMTLSGLLRVSMYSVSKAIFRRRSGSTCWSFIVARYPRPMVRRDVES